ncbi:tRNA(m(1)G37)methyltransferase [Vermiconidia calcicola]|uniref:tRNA(M(1)G37)methyltransferase n=1 Tax=Vermiconidia calcicola TaxID=1690605 RepID=A0ACC3MQD3_9PEZI|nr:tRNA(m(1)G37)methyltransferase [Vermiconidia calcicola]
MASESDPELDPTMFRPPIARGMQILDRSFFQKTVRLKAARVFDNKNISRIRSQLERSKDALQQDRLANVYPDPDPDQAKVGRKCILLRPEVRQDPLPPAMLNESTNGETPHYQTNDDSDHKAISWPHSSTLTEPATQNLISVIPYNLNLDYTYWPYHSIIASILPESLHSEIPSGFSQVGHVVHLNLRETYLPYKHLIAQILIDKNPGARTVINKIDDVGEENEFRTFKYECLAGEDDLNVVVSEAGCEFRFDYGKVYWNPRLSTEHGRLVALFQAGEAVCDVMAGIGPFAVPAGRKGVFVWGNDLNPESYSGLTDAIARNKAGDFVTAFNQDGRTFIKDTVRQLLEDEKKVEIKKKVSRKDPAGTKPEVIQLVEQPKTFQHYVLNLPASALTFLSSFIGLYPPELREKIPERTPMPLVHVYCFSTKDELEAGSSSSIPSGNINEPADPIGDDNIDDQARVHTDAQEDNAIAKICAMISRQLQHEMRPGKMGDKDAVEVWDVRDVAPKKRMFCASFRLPEEVAFRVSG